jgi:hypothetical protein
MQNKQVDLYGEIEQVSTLHLTRRTFHSFILKTEGGNGIKTYQVYINETDTEYYLEDGHRYNVMGFEVAEGVIMAYYADRWGRYCDHCGAWHTRGYWVGEQEYACSEDCAIALYNGNEKAFREDLAMLENEETADDAVTYWTEWD